MHFCNWIEKPEKFRTLTGFEPLTSQFQSLCRSNQLCSEATDVGKSIVVLFSNDVVLYYTLLQVIW